MELRRVEAAEWERLRDLRLRALADAPSAFASTYAEESAFPESRWRERADQAAAGAEVVQFVAELGGELCATVTGIEHEDGSAWLVAMWVAPKARGLGLGRRLVESAAGWARDRGHARLSLWVTETNPAAVRLYESTGFVATGERESIREGATEIVALLVREL